MESSDSKVHYDNIINAWRYIFGDNFHFGIFKDEKMDLNQATNALNEELAGLTDIDDKTHILDIGCGIGTPAFYLHEKFHCYVTGISNSPKGIESATFVSQEKGCAGHVQFCLRDALDTGFENNSFDIVWNMEMSNLIKDKTKLFEEIFRVLKWDGVLVLCDFISPVSGEKSNVWEKMNAFHESDGLNEMLNAVNLLRKVFGIVKTETLEYYREGLESAGFLKVETFDVSESTYQTIGCLRDNILRNEIEILKYISSENVNDFLKACDILENHYRNNILGFGMLRAVKIQ